MVAAALTRLRWLCWFRLHWWRRTTTFGYVYDDSVPDREPVRLYEQHEQQCRFCGEKRWERVGP